MTLNEFIAYLQAEADDHPKWGDREIVFVSPDCTSDLFDIYSEKKKINLVFSSEGF